MGNTSSKMMIDLMFSSKPEAKPINPWEESIYKFNAPKEIHKRKMIEKEVSEMQKKIEAQRDSKRAQIEKYHEDRQDIEVPGPGSTINWEPMAIKKKNGLNKFKPDIKGGLEFKDPRNSFRSIDFINEVPKRMFDKQNQLMK